MPSSVHSLLPPMQESIEKQNEILDLLEFAERTEKRSQGSEQGRRGDGKPTRHGTPSECFNS